MPGGGGVAEAADGGAPRLTLAMRRMSTASTIAHAKHCLRTADAVCFDFDSTLIGEEGIDVLAEHCGAGAEVAAWTTKAMDGGVKFEDAIAARLDLIKPSKNDVAVCLRRHPPPVTPGAAELCAALADDAARANRKENAPAGALSVSRRHDPSV